MSVLLVSQSTVQALAVDAVENVISRTQEIEAGVLLAFLGFALTFVVLSLLTIMIKVTSISVERCKRKEKKEPALAEETTVRVVHPPEKLVPTSIIAAAVAGVGLYLREKSRFPVSKFQEKRIDHWTLSWRIQSSSNLEAFDERLWKKRERPE